MFKNQFLLAQAICEIRYKPELIYFDKRIQVCSQLLEFLPEWDFNDRSFIRLANSNTKESFETHCKRTAFWAFDVNLDDYQERARKIFQRFTDGFGYERLARVGVRLKYVVETELEFDSLKSILYKKLFVQKEEISEKLFRTMTPDTAFSFDFEDEELMYHLLFGPVHEEEIKSKPEFRNLFLDEGKIPAVALFWDMDCYRQEVDRTKISDIINQAGLYTRRKIKALISYLEEGS